MGASGTLERAGRVAVTGTEGVEILRLQSDDGSLTLVGDLADELKALASATVRVSGTPAEAAFGDGVVVTAYEVLEINGSRPVVGVLVAREGRLWVAAEDTVEVMGAPDDLSGLLGAKVWITGPLLGGSVELQSYGVIRRD